MYPKSNTSNQKIQSSSGNSAVKYKNSAMKTLQNLKLNSSHLKTEIEKISNIIKRDKSPQESYIKIAQIKLNRKNDLDQMSMEAFIKSAKIGKKNKTEMNKMCVSHDSFRKTSRKHMKNSPNSSYTNKHEIHSAKLITSSKNLFFNTKSDKITIPEFKTFKTSLYQTSANKNELKKTEENKKSFTSPKEKSNQNIQSIHNEEQHLIYSALIRPKIEVLKPNPEKEQTISKLEQSFPDLNKNVKNNDLLINNLKLDKILYPTKKENGRLSENFSSIQLELPSKSLHEKSSNEESIDIGQIDPSLCKKKSRSEEIVDYTNQFLIKMLEMKLLREESNSSMSVEVYAEDVNNFLADINYDMQEIFKRGSIEKESFLKIHDRSGLDEMDHCESHTNSKNENQSDESTRRDHEKHDEEIDNKTKEDNISEKDIKTNNKILEDQKKINDEEIKKKSNLNEKSKQKDNIIIKEDYINKGFTSMENDKKIVNLIDEGNTTKVIMIDQEVTKNIVEEVKKTKKVFENEKKILNKNKKQKFTVKSNDDIPNKKKLKEIPVKKEPEFKKLKLKEIPLRKTNEKQKNNIYNSEKLKLAVNISEEKNDILKEIISVPYTIDELSKEKNGIFTNEKKESNLNKQLSSTLKDFNQRNTNWTEKKQKRSEELKDKKEGLIEYSLKPKINKKSEKQKIKKTNQSMNKITEVVSFLSANLINIETQNDKINEIPNKKVYQNKESQPGDKVKELYANFQKIRENKNYMKEQKKDAQQNNKNNRNQVKSAEKEINKEISDILKIFKSASKALNSSQILKKNINFGTKNLNN